MSRGQDPDAVALAIFEHYGEPAAIVEAASPTTPLAARFVVRTNGAMDRLTHGVQQPQPVAQLLRVCGVPDAGSSPDVVSLVQLPDGKAVLVLKRCGSLEAIAHDRLREVGESVPGLICAYRLAPDGTATMPFATPAAKDVYGFTPDELAADLGLLAARYHPNDVALLVDGIASSARDLAPWHACFRYEHPQKGWRQIEGWSQPRREADGATVWHGFVMDVTERERLAQELRDKDEQLRVAQRMEAIGRLAGGIAHDFNNLLTVILSYADLAAGSLAPADAARSDLLQVTTAALRATTLTSQLLAFSRKQVLQPRVVDLNDLCAQSLRLFQRLLGEDIEILYRPAPAPATTYADAGQIEQVFMNLAINARDAMPKGGKLTIETENVVLDEAYCRAHADATPGAYVMLAMSDSGVGMEAATRSRIFEPFFTTKAPGKGTGLGLSMVYGMVKQSGGFVYVYSEVGKGTMFKIYLPSVAADGTPLEVRTPPRSVGGVEAILVVEDEEIVRTLVARLLRQLGYDVVVAETPSRALELAAARSDLKLLLTDVIMPGMSGRDLAVRLQATHQHIRVLYMSGYTDNSIVHHGVLDPGIDFLPKPFSVDGLATKVREVLDR